ncbi:MAG: DegT/DnrJ/EryC1/StrS family aminotransferase [Clostridiales Family XIII bacterium]|jgi:arginine/lysine/ornithine decarboxylase|nr:DegT/DnrJ/EryC1/StrS family aminotransferase [Clostridiales Family XIII bacterium]
MARNYLLDQSRTPLFDALRKFSAWDPAPFFVPAHKMGSGIDPRWIEFAGENIFRMDLSEVRWTDDYHGASSAILEAEVLAADAWGAARTRFLVNGTSSGIIASVCGICGDGDEIIVPRNAHKSVVYALVQSGAVPVYVQPELCGAGLVGGLLPETLAAALDAHPGAKAVFAVSPTYHGVISDLERLAEIAHARGIPLIADEAHGNHDYFSDRLPKGALECGADLVCQSTHKMSGSLTQSSMLHVGPGAESSGRVDFERVNMGLSLTQTTSPSYLLLASLDLARSYIATEGARILNEVLDALDKARAEITGLSGADAIPGIAVLGSELAGTYGIYAYEPMRLVLSATGLGLSGYELFRLLREEYGVEAEFGDPLYCVCVAGLGTICTHVEKLVTALRSISARFENASLGSMFSITQTILPPVLPPMAMTPREAWFAAKERVPFAAAAGRVSGELVVPYPPGIPALCPGDRITAEIHDFLRLRRDENCHLHCYAGDGLETLLVVR